MGDEGPRRHRGELFAALAAMGFGSAYVATSFALTAFEPVPAAAWRSLLAAVAVGGSSWCADMVARTPPWRPRPMPRRPSPMSAPPASRE